MVMGRGSFVLLLLFLPAGVGEATRVWQAGGSAGECVRMRMNVDGFAWGGGGLCLFTS